jgi:minor extracellular serine protease Vpr
MKSVNFIKTVLVVLALPLLAGAATRRYIVELSTEPAANFAARNFGAKKESLARPEVKKHLATIHSEQDNAAAEIQKLGGRVVERTDTTSNVLIVDLPEENAAKLSSVPGFKSSHRARRYDIALDQASIVHKFPQAYSQVGGASNAGAGIKIAVIDSGIDITQPAFSDTGFQAPGGFPLADSTADKSLTNNKVIVARSYVSLFSTDPNSPNPPEFDFGASDEEGHGTITSGAAAGMPTGTNVGTFNGAAPGAYLGNYKVFGTPGTNSDGADNEAAILKAINDAVNDGMDIINFSAGGFPPIPAASDMVAQSLNNAVSAGVVTTASAGNDGNGLDTGLFYDSADGLATTIPELISSDGAMNVIEVGASSNQRGFGTALTVGSSKFLVDTEYAITQDTTGAALVYSGAPIIDVSTIDKTGQACNALPAGSLNGAIAFITFNGFDPNADTCDPDAKFDNALNAGAVAGIIYDNFPEDLYDIYGYYGALLGYQFLNSTNLPGGFITYSDGVALKAQLAAQSNATATLDFNFNTVPLNSDRVVFLSSRGPNADFEIKPDLVAVGEDLLGATQSINACDQTLGNCFYQSSGLFYPANGTSGSAPLVAGAVAILKAARPGLTALQYRSLVINSTGPISDQVTGGLARVMDAGAGILDINAALNAEATLIPASLSFGTGGGGSKSFSITNAGTAPDTFSITVKPRDPGFSPQIDQTSVQLNPGSSATVNVSIPGGLQAGEYEGAIHIQGNNTATDTHLVYWLGVPSTTPYLLTDLGSDTQDLRGTLAPAALVFRISDPAGIYMTNILSQVSVAYTATYNASTGNPVTNGNAKVSAPYKYDAYSPGTIAADVTPSSRAGLVDQFTVYVGDPKNPTLSLDFFIFGQ